MDTYDYKLDEDVWHSEANHLLDDDGSPSPTFTNARERALANIASAIHLNEEKISDAQIEQTIIWLKRIKEKRNPPLRYPDTDYGAFYRALDRLKNKPEQISLQKKAYWKSIKAVISGVFLFFAAITSLVLYYADISHWWTAISVVLAVYFFHTMEKLIIKAFVISKDQDRKFFMESLRLAKNTDELNEAGFFMHIKEMHIDKNFDQAASVNAARREIARMRDAIYTESNFDSY